MDRKDSLYFGEIHMHSNLSDGRGRPSDNLRYARDVVDLDFAAITDHAEDLTESKWEQTREATTNFYRPGNFVTLLSFEWTHPSGNDVWEPLVIEGIDPKEIDTPRFGHRNVYYKEIEGDFFSWKDEISNNPEKLWDRLDSQGSPALVIPHHPASYVFPVDWSWHNPDYERLVEIYSMWGSSEIPESEGNNRPIIRGGGEVEKHRSSHVRYALNEGIQVGLIAGSDGHDGNGGRTRHHLNNTTEHQGPFYPSGITGVYAPELTMENIWEALWNRKCFGTTGAKIRIGFSINGHTVGSTFTSEQGKELLLEATISGTADVQKIKLVNSKGIVDKFYGNSPQASMKTTVKKGVKDEYFYIIAHQTDGHVAWSSPIWVTTSSP